MAISSAIALFLKILGVPLSYLSNVIIARIWGAELLGTYIIANSILLTLIALCVVGLPSGLLRFVATLNMKGHIAEVKKLFYQASVIVLIVSTILSLGLYWSRDWLGWYFKAPQLPVIIIFMALAFPFCAFVPLLRETLRGMGLVQWATFQQYTLAPLSLLLTIGMILVVNEQFFYLNQSQSLGVVIWLSNFISWGFLFFRFWFYKKQKVNNIERTESLKSLLRFSFPLYLIALIALPVDTLDGIILGLCTSPEEVAYYGVAARIDL